MNEPSNRRPWPRWVLCQTLRAARNTALAAIVALLAVVFAKPATGISPPVTDYLLVVPGTIWALLQWRFLQLQVGNLDDELRNLVAAERRPQEPPDSSS